LLRTAAQWGFSHTEMVKMTQVTKIRFSVALQGGEIEGQP